MKNFYRHLATGGLVLASLSSLPEWYERYNKEMPGIVHTLHTPGHEFAGAMEKLFPDSYLSHGFGCVDRASESLMKKILSETPRTRQEFVKSLDLAVIPDYLLDPVRPFNGYPLLDSVALRAFELARREVKERTGVDMYIISGFRSYREQEELCRKNPYAAPPGFSSHEEARGLDFRFVGNGFISLSRLGIRKILSKYGFEPLRQSPGQEFRHFEYVGNVNLQIDMAFNTNNRISGY